MLDSYQKRACATLTLLYAPGINTFFASPRPSRESFFTERGRSEAEQKKANVKSSALRKRVCEIYNEDEKGKVSTKKKIK